MLLAGEVAMNVPAQGALRQFTQWLWIDHSTFQLGGGHFTTEVFPRCQTFSASQAFSRFYTLTFLCRYFQKITSQQKHKASHPRIKQYFYSKPKQKFLAASQPESAKASSSECKGSFGSVVQEEQHSTVRISKASSVSAKSQS